MRYGYARVSTDDQHLDRQRHMLAAQGCDRIVEEIESGVKARKRLDALLASLQAGDDLIIEQIDRFGRTAVEVILLMDELHRRGGVLRILALPGFRAEAQRTQRRVETFRSEGLSLK